MNTPVSFEIAKLLKGKGFCVNNTHQNYYIENTYYNEDGELIECQTQSGSLSLFKGRYSAPTVAEVVMWLYEKHGIWIGVQKDWDCGQCFGFYATIDANDCNINTDTFNSPREAYEAAIEYTLNNLI